MIDLRLDADVTREDVYDWFKSERLAHAETKLAYDVLVDEFNEMESDLKDEIIDLKKRLAELEDALFTNKEMMGDDAGWFIKVQDWQPGYKEINDAIKNVKERRK